MRAFGMWLSPEILQMAFLVPLNDLRYGNLVQQELRRLSSIDPFIKVLSQVSP